RARRRPRAGARATGIALDFPGPPGAGGALQRRQLTEELAGRGDSERYVVRDEPLVRRMDLRVGEAEAGHDRRNPLARERRHDRDRAAGSDQCRPPADDALERVLTEP